MNRQYNPHRQRATPVNRLQVPGVAVISHTFDQTWDFANYIFTFDQPMSANGLVTASWFDIGTFDQEDTQGYQWLNATQCLVPTPTVVFDPAPPILFYAKNRAVFACRGGVIDGYSVHDTVNTPHPQVVDVQVNYAGLTATVVFDQPVMLNPAYPAMLRAWNALGTKYRESILSVTPEPTMAYSFTLTAGEVVAAGAAKRWTVFPSMVWNPSTLLGNAQTTGTYP